MLRVLSVTVERCILGHVCRLVLVVNTELRVLVVAVPLVELLGLVAAFFSRVFLHLHTLLAVLLHVLAP